MNAYELAKYIEDDIQIQEGIADMLREQADRIAELEKQAEHYKNKAEYLDKRELELLRQTKPLSDADIEEISHQYHYTYNPDYLGFARAIEERHGIK